MNKRKIPLMFTLCAVAVIVTAVMSICLGSAGISPAQFWQAVTVQAENEVYLRIIKYVRLPRTAACLLAGAALAVSGAITQAVLANRLASPGIIGVNSGAGFAVTVCCAAGAVSGFATAGAAFAGALIAAILVSSAAKRTGSSRVTVILGGVAVNSILNAASEAVVTLVPEAGTFSSDFRVGGFSAVSVTRLVPAAAVIIFALIAVLTLCNELDVITLGEDTAQGLGLNAKRMRWVFLALAALLAGAAVSFCGLLGFVGLIVPHIVKRLAGSESRILLPMCALFGAAAVTLCDLVSRLIFAPYEIPAGILLSLIGGPFFIFILLKGRRGGNA